MSSDSVTRIVIEMPDTSLLGTLNNSAISASLLAQLPLELSFDDFGGQEKLAALPAPLERRGAPAGSGAEPGTIGYYAPEQVLVLYYASVGYFPGIIPLGSFDDVSAVRDSRPFTATVSAER